MANVVSVNVYQINQKAPLNVAQTLGFSTTGNLLRDTSASPTRSLSTGVNVYSAIQLPDGTLYYCQQTLAQLVTLFNS